MVHPAKRESTAGTLREWLFEPPLAPVSRDPQQAIHRAGDTHNADQMPSNESDVSLVLADNHCHVRVAGEYRGFRIAYSCAIRPVN
jgi:hypothetical protein